jgi:multiple sugar transport system ATP-binding protein
MTMCDRLVILKDGELQQVGAPKDTYDHPENEFVGGFIGSPSMNFLDVAVEGSGERITLTDGEGFSFQLSREYSTALREASSSRQFRLGIRPEDVYTSETGGTQTTVDVIEPVGSDNYLYLDLRPDFIARVDADIEPAPGDTVRITFDESKLRLFERDSGDAVDVSAERVVEQPAD